MTQTLQYYCGYACWWLGPRLVVEEISIWMICLEIYFYIFILYVPLLWQDNPIYLAYGRHVEDLFAVPVQECAKCSLDILVQERAKCNSDILVQEHAKSDS